MSTETTTQILDSAVEASGLSICTATKTAEENRLGTIYRKDILAAAQPVWFHPLQDGRYIALMAKRWFDATVGDGGPNSYSDYTESTLPYWTVIDPVTGSISGASLVPSNLSGTLTLIAGASRIDYLYVLGTAEGVPYVSHHRVDTNGQLILQAEELIAPLEVYDDEDLLFTVTFNAGLYIDGSHLILFGTDEDGKLYRARKHWGRIGVNRGADPFNRWSYQGARGWHDSPNAPDTITALGTIDATDAVVTRAAVPDREYLAVSDVTATDFFVSRYVDIPWKPVSTNSSGSLYLQPQLRYRAEALAEGTTRAIPWVSTEYDDTADAEQLIVEWGLLPI